MANISPSDLPLIGTVPRGIGFCKDSGGNVFWDDGAKLVPLNLSNDKNLVGGYYKTQPGETLIDVSTVLAAGFSMAGATNIKSDNSTITWFGTGSCVDTTNQGGSGATLNCTRTLSTPRAALGVAPSVLFPVWIEDFTKINTIIIRFSMGDTAFTNNYQFTYSVGPGAATWSKRNGWHLISIGTGDWTANGTVAWATQTINAIRISFLNASGQNNARIVFDDFIINNKAKAKFIMMCDGSYSTQYTFIKPLLKALGLKATFGTTRGDLNTAGRLTTAQLNSIIADGHAISPRNLTAFNTLTADQCITEAAAAQQYLIDNFGIAGSIGSKFFVYNQSKYYASGASDGDTTVTARLSSELGIVFGRTTDSTNSDGYLTLGAGGVPPNLMTAPIIGSWSGNAEATLKANIDTAIDRSAACIYYVHNPTYGSFDDPGLVRRVLEYVASKQAAGLIDSVTVPEFYYGMV